MTTISHKALSSFAFKNGASFIGGIPRPNVLRGTLGVLVFLFGPKHQNNFFISWVRANFDFGSDYQIKDLEYKGKRYQAVFLNVPQSVNKKFLLSFRSFNQNHNLVTY